MKRRFFSFMGPYFAFLEFSDVVGLFFLKSGKREWRESGCFPESCRTWCPPCKYCTGFAWRGGKWVFLGLRR